MPLFLFELASGPRTGQGGLCSRLFEEGPGELHRKAVSGGVYEVHEFARIAAAAVRLPVSGLGLL